MENTTENQITVTDLNLLKNIIDLASTRGAFRASEMQEIGTVYNRLSTFLEAVVAHAQEQQLAEAGTQPDSTESQGE
jgi:hypothetical protein